MDLISDPNALSNVLNLLSANDTNSVKQGEKLLKTASKKPQFLLSLLNQVSGSPVVEIRHHAALLLKKKMEGLFKKLMSSHQAAIKTQLLSILGSEPAKSVAVSIAGCVASAAKASFSVGIDWPELFQAIMVMAQSPNETQRVLNYRLLEQLSEAIIESLRPHTATLVQLFVAGCQDPSISVSKAAMMSTSAYISCLPINAEEVMQMQVVLTPILSVMTNCLQTDEQVVSDGLEVFQECLLMKQPLINDHLEALVPFVVGIIQTEDYDQPLRAAAGQTLMTIMENRPKLVAKKNLVTPTLSCMASIIAKSTENAKMFNFSETTGTLEEEEDDEDDETSMLQLAHMCIDTMALHIPSKHFIEPALALCSQGMQSTDPSMRKAGCAILGLISEGCCDPLRPLLPTIIPALVAAVSDDDVNTKEMACFALGQFSEHCQPEILSFHTGILPALYNALDDPRVNILQTACYVLEMFCEFLDQDSLRPYLEALLSKLGALLQHPSDQVQGTALAAISSTVLAAEMEILPYVPVSLNYSVTAQFNNLAFFIAFISLLLYRFCKTLCLYVLVYI